MPTVYTVQHGSRGIKARHNAPTQFTIQLHVPEKGEIFDPTVCLKKPDRYN